MTLTNDPTMVLPHTTVTISPLAPQGCADLEQGLRIRNQPAQVHEPYYLLSCIALFFQHIFYFSNRPWCFRITSLLGLGNGTSETESALGSAPQADEDGTPSIGLPSPPIARPTGGLAATKEVTLVFGLCPTIGGVVTSKTPENTPRANKGICIPNEGGVLHWSEGTGLVNVDGGYGDIFLGRFDNGARVAIKRLRHHQGSTALQLDRVSYSYEHLSNTDRRCQTCTRSVSPSTEFGPSSAIRIFCPFWPIFLLAPTTILFLPTWQTETSSHSLGGRSLLPSPAFEWCATPYLCCLIVRR